MITRLDPPIPVSVTSDTLPTGMDPQQSRHGWCYAWRGDGIDGHRQWIVVMNDTGDVVDVPQPEIKVDTNWSYGRRNGV